MEPAKLHGSQRDKTRKFARYMQLEEKAKKSQKKQHYLGEDRFGYAESGSSNKPRHSSGLPSKTRSSVGLVDMKRNSTKVKRKSHPRDSSDEEDWNHRGSENVVENGKIERIVSGRIVNQLSASDSDSGLDSQIIGPKFIHVDVNLKKGTGDEPLPHAVPITGLGSIRTDRSANFAAKSSRPLSVGSVRRSTSTGDPVKASSRSHSAGMSVRNSSHLPSGRSSRVITSTRVKSAFRSRSSSESSDGLISPRTYNVLSPITRRSQLPQHEKSSKTARSSKSMVNLPSQDASPRSARQRDQPPGVWVSEERKSNPSNLCVWAITDPPQLPPGIVWEKVNPPTSPVLSYNKEVPTHNKEVPSHHKEDSSPKEVAVETDAPEIEDVGKENEPEDETKDTSIHIIPELTPSLETYSVVPKTVIRKVVMPENVGYPGFCEPSETELRVKKKRIPSKKVAEDNKSVATKQKEQSKSKNRASAKKEQPQKTCVHKVTKRNGITPFSWRAGLKCARRELGPWKIKVASEKASSKGDQENSEIQKELIDICKFVEEAEKKISEYKTCKSDEEFPEDHLFSKDSAESKKLEMEQFGERLENKELEDLIDDPKSSSRQAEIEVSPENKSEMISKKSSEDSFILDEFMKDDSPSKKSLGMNKRPLSGTSDFDLNNAFIADNVAVLPKKVNSQQKFPSNSKGVTQSKCSIRHYDPMAIKEYIRTQKKQRQVKLVEEKEKKKMLEEKRKAKLQELRSKSKELIEESLKKKAKCVNKEIEFYQMLDKQFDELALNINLKDMDENAETVSIKKPFCHISTERKIPSLGDSYHSDITTQSQNSLKEKLPNKLNICLPSDIKLDTASAHRAEDRVSQKSVQHVALQTEEDLLNSLSDKKKNAAVVGITNIACSPIPFPIDEPKLPICEGKTVDRATSLSEKSSSSKADSDKIAIGKDLCHSIQREMKKLAHNVFALEKQRMIELAQERGAFPSVSIQGGVHPRKSLEAGDLVNSSLNNKKMSALGNEKLSIIRNDSPLEEVFPAQNLVNPLCLPLTSHSFLDLPSRTKPSVKNIITEGQNGYSGLDAGDASVNMHKLTVSGVERKTPWKNISANLLDIKHNYTSMSDSIISEGPLSDGELANLARLKESETKNLHENAQSKNVEEKKEDEIPLWLRKPPMEAHPFNFITAVKLKLKRFLEEQNKTILTDMSSNTIQIPKPSDELNDDDGEELENQDVAVENEPEVNYESDFEPSVASGSGPSQNDEKVSAANSSNLDTATEDILPTDDVPPSNVPFSDTRKETADDNSDNISEISKKSGSVASDLSHFSNINHQLMAPNFTLSRSGEMFLRKNNKETESKSSTAEVENVKDVANESDVLSVLSLPSAKLSCKSDKSSYGSCKTDLSIASKSGLVNEDFSSNKIESKSKILPSTVTQRKNGDEESIPRFDEVMSSISTVQLDKIQSDGSHISSKDRLSQYAASSDFGSSVRMGKEYENQLYSEPHSSVPHQLTSLKELNDKHSQKLAEMEMKAIEHRLEMERAFEKERQKLELALEEAKKTVIDSKLEATKFISNAAVELVKSQAEATKANAEATRHISEAKAIDALKLETISAQSASAAAFAAVQAAIKQLQSFKKVKQLSKQNSVPENSFTSTASEAGSSTSERKSIITSPEGESELSSLAKSIPEESKLIESTKTVEKSTNNTENKVQENVNTHPEDSSLNSISENISEPEYSSKFDETASEGGVKSAPKLFEEGTNAMGSYFPSKAAKEKKKVSTNIKKKNEIAVKNLDTTNETDISLGSPQLNEDSSNSDHDSFTKFSLSMFQQLMREEEMRAQHQQALLKLREEALIDKTKAEMILLELKKKQCREKGQEDAVSSIRKKQRGLLLRLKLERDEILRLKKSHKTASHERRMMLTQQQHIVKMRLSTKEIMNKLHTKKLPPTPKAIRAMGFIGSVLSTSKSNVELNTEESALESASHSSVVPEEIHSADVTHSDVSLPTAPIHSSHASLSDSGSHHGTKKNVRRVEKQAHRLDDLEKNKKFLSEREKHLNHRRQAVEELIVWRKRLEQEEERVRALETQALVSTKAQQLSIGTKEFSAFKADRSTSPLQFEPSVEVKSKEDAATSMADLSLTHSSILEEVPSESQKSSFSVVEEIDASSKKNDLGGESLQMSASASVIKTEVSIADQSVDSTVGAKKGELDSKSSKTSIPQTTEKEETKDSPVNITIKSPLTSYMPGRQKRRHSSGSDESLILSQNETASEQSDVEGKISALQEQLRRRKMEAELLKREQKRCRRERLKAKEQSLIKQIQAYDQYIQKARLELEQEYESPTTSLVKPQIKQPRVAEWKKTIDDSRDLSEASEKVSVLETGINEKSSLESQNEVQKQSEKLSLESIPESAEKVTSLTLEQEFAEQVCDSNEPSQIKNDSGSSITEVLEDIQIPTEESPASEDSQGSLSRESSVETTIESPTKQDVVEPVGDSNLLNEKQADIPSKPDKVVLQKDEVVKDDSVSPVMEIKSDKYDEDSFEPTSGSNVKHENEFSMNKVSGSLKSLDGQESDEIAEELSLEKHDVLSSRESVCENETDKIENEEIRNAENHSVEEIQAEQDVKEFFDDSVLSQSHESEEDPATQINPNETYIVPEDTNAQSDEKAEEITENILKNLLDESVVEAEILMNKNSTCTNTVQEFEDKVKELVPLYEIESYEEVLEQKLEDFEPVNEEMVNIVDINCEDVEEVHVEEIETNDVDFRSLKGDAVLSGLLQLLLEDATAEMLCILARRESFFRQEKDNEVVMIDECAFESTTSICRNSDVIKRVQQIMLESSLSQVSPREKSRPQDLMITTYDVLSPDSSNSSSPVMGQPSMEMVFVQEEKYSPKSPVKYTTGKAIQFLQVEHSGGLGASAAGGESSNADNDAFTQEWFEEDFGLNSTLREVEEIQLQRLQIEREIEQLQLAQAKEQQQKQYPYNFYIREIPNKPPPPYTPPEETPRISSSFAGPISPLSTPRDSSPRAAVPTDQEEIANFVKTAAGNFYDAWTRGDRLDSVEPPSCSKLVSEEDSYHNEGGVDGDLRRKSGRSYSQFLFDLSRQLVDELLDNVEAEKFVSVPTRFGSKKWRPSLPLPNRECFSEEVKKQALVILGFISKETRDNFMFSWTVKKRDHIEEIIVREMQEEERFWTNFDEEERYIKEQIAESLFELLLVDTTKAVAMAYDKRVERLSVND